MSHHPGDLETPRLIGDESSAGSSAEVSVAAVSALASGKERSAAPDQPLSQPLSHHLARGETAEAGSSAESSVVLMVTKSGVVVERVGGAKK